jgi:hypothetical protein
MKAPPAFASILAAAISSGAMAHKGIIVLERILPRRHIVPAQRKNRRQPPRRLFRLPASL